MNATLKSLRALSDPTRLRIVALLEKDELSVNELQEITRMGQSRISTHLGLLQDSGLVQSRREGKRTFYKLNTLANGAAAEFIQLANRGAKELPEHGADQINLKRILNRRREEPGKAIAGAHRILKVGGQILILDLAKHNFVRAHELYGDRWLGFAESDLHRWLEEAGFKKIEVNAVAREEQEPHFETVLAGGV